MQRNAASGLFTESSNKMGPEKLSVKALQSGRAQAVRAGYFPTKLFLLELFQKGYNFI
jgi:hypothetical protein